MYLKPKDITAPKLKNALGASHVERTYFKPYKAFTRGPFVYENGFLDYQIQYPNGDIFMLNMRFTWVSTFSTVTTHLIWSKETHATVGMEIDLPEEVYKTDFNEFARYLKIVHKQRNLTHRDN